jgi:uncharacterized protein (TIGR00299 family) protein
MKIAYFDCFSGISGDMILGALVDAGLDFDALCTELKKLPLEGFRLERRTVKKHEIAGTKIDVILETKEGHEVIEGPGDDSHSHGDAHELHHHHDQIPDGDHGPARHLKDLVTVIEEGDLDASIKHRAITIFDHLATAESKMHGMAKDEVHLHEVSGIDAIVDITGACIGLHLLGIDTVYASALPLGNGFVRCAHGRMPVPAPGALELMRNVPVYQTDARGEMVTPTGAAFLKATVISFGPMPRMTLKQIGYGAGTKDFPEHPNLLRVCIGEG